MEPVTTMTAHALMLAKLLDECRKLASAALGESVHEIFLVVKYRPLLIGYPWVVNVGRDGYGAHCIAARSPEELAEILREDLASGEIRERLFREVKS